MSVPPSPTVLAAFGASGEPQQCRGGQTTAWRVADLVFKRGVDEWFQHWLGTAVSALPRNGFRLAEPVTTCDGDWLHDGWSATRFVTGAATTSDWPAVLDAGRAFHAATRALPAPPWLTERDSRWARADQLAWDDDAPGPPGMRELVARLRAAGRPPDEPQLVHGDLAGNVLLAAGESPAVIDISPYWRPPAYADGIVVADALVVHGAPPTLAAETGVPLAAVARGLLFRLLTDHDVARTDRAATALGL